MYLSCPLYFFYCHYIWGPILFTKFNDPHIIGGQYQKPIVTKEDKSDDRKEEFTSLKEAIEK